MHENFGQIEQFISELRTLSIFPLFSHIFYTVKWENAKIKTKDVYKEIFQEMMQNPMLFNKIARTNHRNDFELLAILLHLGLVYCANTV